MDWGDMPQRKETLKKVFSEVIFSKREPQIEIIQTTRSNTSPPSPRFLSSGARIGGRWGEEMGSLD
jgi:hypothetical protein